MENVNSISQNASSASKRQAGLDVLKCICAFLVICIHVPFNFKGSEYFLLVTRIAVPSFFMISGFFYDFIIRRNKELQQIKKVFILVISTNILYFFWCIIWRLITGADIVRFLETSFTGDNILRYLLFNRSIVSGHLWYLAALLYTLIIVALFRKLGALKLLYILSPPMIAADLIFGTYGPLLFGRTFLYFYFRNFIFVGIPYFILGHLINMYKDKITSLFCLKPRRATWILSLSAILFCLISFAEFYFLNRAHLDGSRENYIGTVFFTISVFLIFAIFYRDNHSKAEKLCSYIGRIQSSSIYIYHPIVIKLCSLTFSAMGLSALYSAIAPVIVFALTSGIIFIVSYISFKTVIK